MFEMVFDKDFFVRFRIFFKFSKVNFVDFDFDFSRDARRIFRYSSI